MQNKVELEAYFKEEINRLSQIEIEKVKDEIEAIRAKAVIELEAEAEKEYDQTLDMELKELQSDHAIALSRLKEEKNRKLMAERDALTAQLFQEATDQLYAFVKSSEYLPLLIKKLSQLACRQYQQAELYVAKHDENILAALCKAYEHPVQSYVDPNIKIGGFRLECPNEGIVVDETFDSHMEEQKEWFYSHSGLIIQ